MDRAYFTGASSPEPVANVETFEPDALARGPWSPDMMHGRLLGGLAARQLEAAHGGDGWRAARLTVDLFRPAAMAPVTLTTSPVREGRKVRVADAMLECEGHVVGRVTAVFLVTGEEPRGKIWRPERVDWPSPDDTDSDPRTGSAEHNGWIFRVVSGGMGTGEQTRVWTNDTVSLVDGESMSPLVRAAVSGDIACPLTNFSDDGLHYINADYTMLLGRYPVGDWIGIEASEQIQATGISMAMATLRDELGPFATSGGSSLTRPPLDH
ncbi:MAG: acyl-CoA thioesterase domain-containing protein [Actinomycetota bacterium]